MTQPELEQALKGLAQAQLSTLQIAVPSVGLAMALFEVLIEKGLVTREEVVQRADAVLPVMSTASSALADLMKRFD